jgi:hypothetical protein
LRHERIRSTKSWYNGAPRRDCVFIGNSDSEEPGFAGLHVARVLLFFSFNHDMLTYPCAFVHWFSTVGDTPCDETGMWMVEPDFIGSKRVLGVIHLDTIMRGAHLHQENFQLNFSNFYFETETLCNFHFRCDNYCQLSL